MNILKSTILFTVATFNTRTVLNKNSLKQSIQQTSIDSEGIKLTHLEGRII